MTKNRTLRLPDELDRRLRVAAAEEEMSVHAYILLTLEADWGLPKADDASYPIIEKPPIPEGQGSTVQVPRFELDRASFAPQEPER